MSATILPFHKPDSRPVITQRMANSMQARILDDIAQVVLQDYAAWPYVVADEAIRAASEVLASGGSFLDAVEAAENIVISHSPAETRQLTASLLKRRARRQEAFFNLAARVIEDRLQAKPWDKHYALTRARRVIEGGGTINAALCHALGDDYTGGAA